MKFNLYSFALGFVFFVFGVWQILNPGYWTAYLPKFLTFIASENFFRINGTFNLIVGLGLIFNIYPLIFSALAIFHLLGVIFTLGLYNDIAIRDLVLLILALGIFLDSLKKFRKNE
ncbi:hypothetical protein HRbin35_00535 [bacterium HR35]|nr:hypothetical protein HRbin35_00535 [bacterium HR35]